MHMLPGGRIIVDGHACDFVKYSGHQKPSGGCKTGRNRSSTGPQKLCHRKSLPQRCRGQRYAAATASTALPLAEKELSAPGRHLEKITLVMKFGGSSVANASRMREVAGIICSFPDELPCIVLSAMGKTTNLLLQAGEEAAQSGQEDGKYVEPLRAIEDLHRDTARELRVGNACLKEVDQLLESLQQFLKEIAAEKELSDCRKDYLVSYGERLSTRIFAAFLRQMGIPAAQHDAFALGLITTDDFTQAEVLLPETLKNLKQSLELGTNCQGQLQIVTGFLGQGISTGQVTTLGRGGSDLTATIIGAALGLSEVQVWKDVDGVLTSDPRLVTGARPVPFLTYEEATELAFFGATVLHPSAMQPAQQCDNLAVRVKNSYNRQAAGTLISRTRDMSQALMTSIVLKGDVTLMDIVSTRMLGQFGFLAQIFDIFRQQKISVDVVATSDIAVSLTLDPSRLWSRGLYDAEFQALVSCFKDIAKVSLQQNMSIISLICNVERTSEILERVFGVLRREGINVKMMSQGASKTNISLIVGNGHGQKAVQALHHEFF